MIAERIEDLELMEGWYEDDPTMRGFLRGRWHLCQPWCRTACVTWAKRLCG
jgi:hypothetical protein